MRPVYLQCNKIPYLFDIDDCKLYQLNGKDWLEIDNQVTLNNIRLKATEISRHDALKLLGNPDHWQADGMTF